MPDYLTSAPTGAYWLRIQNAQPASIVATRDRSRAGSSSARRGLFTPLLGLLAFVAACGGTEPVGPPPPAAVASVTISGPASIQAGRTAQLSATALDADGKALAGRSIQWTSDKEAVATVVGNGTTAIITAVGVGTATITASSEGKVGTLTITVNPAGVHSLSIAPDTATLSLAGTRQLTAVTRDSLGNVLAGREVSWTSLDPSIAKVSGTGVVTAGVAGTARITASSGGKADTVSITVSPFLSGERTLVPGVVHRYVWDAAKPWAIHILEVDVRACGVDLRTVKANDQLIGRARTTALAAQVEERSSRPVLAAINGDFFTPLGVPQGAQVANAEIVKTSSTAPAFGVTADETPFIGVHPLAGELRARSGESQPLRQVNERPDAQSVALYNRFVGSVTPSDTGVVEVVVSRLSTSGNPGETMRGVVLQVDTMAAGINIPEGSVVLAGRSAIGTFLRTSVTVGDTVSWTYRFRALPGQVTEMIGGNFQLLRGGQDVLGEAADRERHPRTGIGLKPDGTVLMVTVDGRQPNYSVGMSQPEMIEFFRQLGATELLNLDGGGSTTLVINGQLANRPSDPSGERPVANALTVLGPAAGTCK